LTEIYLLLPGKRPEVWQGNVSQCPANGVLVRARSPHEAMARCPAWYARYLHEITYPAPSSPRDNGTTMPYDAPLPPARVKAAPGSLAATAASLSAGITAALGAAGKAKRASISRETLADWYAMADELETKLEDM
jgi:hypothetical protein